MKKILVLILAAFLVMGLAACNEGEIAVPGGTAVEVQTVACADIATEDTVTGMVVAGGDLPVMAPIACKVAEVYVRAGDTVKKNDPLFKLDTADIRDLYGTLLNTYSSTKSLLDESVRQSKQTYENMKVLFEMGAVSQNQLDQTKLAVLQAESTRESTLAQLGVKDVVDALSDPVVRAPADGTVAAINVKKGVQTSNTSVAAVVSEIARPQLTVSVSEVLQPQLSAGDTVTVVLPSLDNKEVEGVILSVASAISQSTALYEVQIALPEDLEVSIGMFAKAVFHTDSRTKAVVVPTEAILTQEDTQYVYIVRDDAAYRVEVTTGLIGATETEILSGLSGGEQLVVRGQSYLSDGAPVRITERGAK
ncbi:MAG: efflux RND transporter periplasmic adaptor subunit [Eubacteriales bacterium]|nr:efflux RND transporter periplasmic adaptor subunit [Eubacteriales bacterium]